MAKKICSLATALLGLLLILKISSAIPSFYSLQNNTYVFGRDSDVFSINITEPNLNTSSVTQHIRVFEAGSSWHNTTATCFSLSSTQWICNNTVSGFGGLASDGKVFIYYYDAYDSSGNYNVSSLYFVTIDRSPPMIRFIDPLNDTYVGGLVNITLEATDYYSGINDNAVYYSTDYSVWNQANRVGSYFNGSWDASSLANNQSVTLYANASDNLGNSNSTYINVLIDNELPKIFITLPLPNQVLNGTVTLQVVVTDQYSGADNSSVRYVVDSATKYFNCSGTKSLSCSVEFKSSDASDGIRTIYFYAKDMAKNSGQNSTAVTIDNLPPSISILNPQSNAVVYGVINITANITDVGVGTDTIAYRWEGSSKTGDWSSMDCSGSVNSYLCNASWNTKTVSDGNYVIKINATDKLNHHSEGTVSFLIDNFGQTTTTQTTAATTTIQTPTGETVSSTTTTAETSPLVQKISEALAPILEKIPEPVKNKLPLIVLAIAIIATVILIALLLKELREKRTIEFT